MQQLVFRMVLLCTHTHIHTQMMKVGNQII